MNLNMISNYVKAKWSKGIDNKKVDVTTKDIRLLGCFGDGEEISICPGLRPSEEKMGGFICGECGCGDGNGKYLNGDEGEYTKLDHPYLSCPRKMPGFSDYIPATEEDTLREKRKKMIEGILGTDIVYDKSLVRPEMSKEEKAEMESKRQNQKNNTNNTNNLRNLKDKINKELEDKGLTKGTDMFKTEFMNRWQTEVVNLNKNKEGCPKCAKKKKIREKILQDFKNQGIEEDFGNIDFKNKFDDIYKKELIQAGLS